MRTVVINARELTYTVYEGRQLVAKYQASDLLNAEEIERLRTGCIQPLEVA